MPALHYFVSDVQLGAGNMAHHEEKFVRFLKSLPAESSSLYLLGDIFDFWYEYKYVVPKGFVRVLGSLAELVDRGVSVYFLRGNHDMWTFGYLEKEIGITVLDECSVVNIAGRRFFLAHGDELTGERSHIWMKRVFRSRLFQSLLSACHPRWTFSVAGRWSRRNRLTEEIPLTFRGINDPLYKYVSEIETKEKIDYFIFGHLHTHGDCQTPAGATFCILGDWLNGCDYLVFDAERDRIEWRSESREPVVER